MCSLVLSFGFHARQQRAAVRKARSGLVHVIARELSLEHVSTWSIVEIL